MSKPEPARSHVVTARISAETLALVDRIAAARDRSRAWVIARAIEAQAKADVELMDFIQVGIDSADRGELISQEEMEAWIEARYEQAAAAE